MVLQVVLKALERESVNRVWGDHAQSAEDHMRRRMQEKMASVSEAMRGA